MLVDAVCINIDEVGDKDFGLRSLFKRYDIAKSWFFDGQNNDISDALRALFDSGDMEDLIDAGKAELSPFQYDWFQNDNKKKLVAEWILAVCKFNEDEKEIGGSLGLRNLFCVGSHLNYTDDTVSRLDDKGSICNAVGSFAVCAVYDEDHPEHHRGDFSVALRASFGVVPVGININNNADVCEVPGSAEYWQHISETFQFLVGSAPNDGIEYDNGRSQDDDDDDLFARLDRVQKSEFDRPPRILVARGMKALRNLICKEEEEPVEALDIESYIRATSLRYV